jgi:hypothetical protein
MHEPLSPFTLAPRMASRPRFHVCIAAVHAACSLCTIGLCVSLSVVVVHTFQRDDCLTSTHSRTEPHPPPTATVTVEQQ